MDMVLAMYLDSPLQSWGYRSHFERRTTLHHPTRSGILGIMCAAMGIDRADVKGLRRLDPLRLSILCFGESDQLMDYHTVGGGYDKNKQEERQSIPHTADGKVRGTVPTRRYYLQDTKFGILVEGEEPLLSEIAAALQNPRWGIWLGRKSCIPTSPVYQGLFHEEEEAVTKLRQLANVEDGAEVRRVRGRVPLEDATDLINDIPLDFSKRLFAPHTWG
jgi:CRISPR system Cascade subunit CasD